MNIFDRIKSFFNKNQLKELPQGVISVNDENVWRRSLRYDINENNNDTLKEPSLEECIKEFIEQYGKVLKEDSIQPKNRSYAAFERMFCGEEERAGKNEINQKKLMNYVSKNKNLRTDFQQSNNRTVFLHIQGDEGINTKEDTEMEKIYLNCKRENIALLAKGILNKIEKPCGNKLQMKYVAEQIFDEDKRTELSKEIKNYQRNDKIVIYSKDSNMTNTITEKINELKKEKPNLFSEDKYLPMMPKKYGFIGVVGNNKFESIDTYMGTITGETYNEYMSNIMSNSILIGFDKTIGVDKDIKSTNEQLATCVEKFNKLNEKGKKEVIENSGKMFKKICAVKNIDTVYTPVNNKNLEVNQEER